MERSRSLTAETRTLPGVRRRPIAFAVGSARGCRRRAAVLLALAASAGAATGCAPSDRARFMTAYETTVAPSDEPPNERFVAAFGLDLPAGTSGDGLETAVVSVDVPD